MIFTKGEVAEPSGAGAEDAVRAEEAGEVFGGCRTRAECM